MKIAVFLITLLLSCSAMAFKPASHFKISSKTNAPTPMEGFVFKGSSKPIVNRLPAQIELTNENHFKGEWKVIKKATVTKE
jgi:hypothetical protein